MSRMGMLFLLYLEEQLVYFDKFGKKYFQR